VNLAAGEFSFSRLIKTKKYHYISRIVFPGFFPVCPAVFEFSHVACPALSAGRFFLTLIIGKV